MDLLIEKLDGSRYYLSQYKVLITEFEESAPSVTRNSKQLDQRNGNIDFGGWHTDKTINITGYYRADDIDEEEMLREKLYALLSNPGGYYITQLKTSPDTAVERPGETSGGYYDKLSNYPSHKRFLVYTEAPEMELVGNVNGTLLYKLTAEFKTIKLPYGESVPRNFYVKPNVPYYGRNLLKGTAEFNPWDGIYNFFLNGHLGLTFALEKDSDGDIAWHLSGTANGSGLVGSYNSQLDKAYPSTYAFSVSVKGTFANTTLNGFHVEGSSNVTNSINWSSTYSRWVATGNVAPGNGKAAVLYFDIKSGDTVDIWFKKWKFEKGSVATPWSPAPEDPEYNAWYFDTYYNTKNLFIPYSGTVPCNQLEQGFTIEITAKESSSSLSFKIDDTELTYSGAVAAGDVFLFTGFSYTQNGLSIVSKTNKAYFTLQPDKPNRITCNVPGTVRILGFQNLYA